MSIKTIIAGLSPKRLASIGVVTATVLAATLALPSPAQADAFRCGSAGSDPRAWCAYVKNVGPAGLNVRSGPGTGYPVVAVYANGQMVEVDCWAYGTSVNGYNIWSRLYTPTRVSWVSDYYLTTGIVQNYVHPC
ncbi:SH3 domain-containing protein [Micromonospora sp. NPDC050187]|uniref:SH3 domain-containing protein n=1 Tax=Micromonospora sp. NPDC050187 TaxID=3364277 RepID=UPI003796A5BB